MKPDHQVERKSGYITNRIYTLGTRDKDEILTGCRQHRKLKR
jgi:hypothetical protein